MRVVAIANEAGSAGKTTTAVSLAALLAAEGKQVVLIDLDPQANATAWLGHDPDLVEVTSGDVLRKRATLAEALLDTSVPGLRLVPASAALNGDIVALHGEIGAEQRLRLALRTPGPGFGDVDVVLIDCPGAMSVVTVAAIIPATSVVTVTRPASKELAGIPRLEETIADLAENYDLSVTMDAIVPCMVKPSSGGALYRDAMVQLRDAYTDLVTPPVRDSVRAAEAMSYATPLPVFAPREPITDDYRAVLADLQAKGVL